MLNVATESAASAPIPPLEPADVAVIDTRYADYKIIRRNARWSALRRTRSPSP